MGKSSGGKTSVTEYYLAIHFGIALKIDTLLEIHIGEKLAWSGEVSEEEVIEIHKPDLFGGVKKEGGVSGQVYFLPGAPTQVLPAALAERMQLTPETCPAYRGLASAFFVSGQMDAGWTPSTGFGGGDGSGVPGGGGGQIVWDPPGGRHLTNLV